MTVEGIAPDGRSWVHPPDRASWRAWLIEHHATSRGVWLVGYRRVSGKPAMDYEAATEELLCVGWIDSQAGKLDADRAKIWVCPRKPRSVWSRPNRERVARLTAAGRMLPAGLAAVEEAKRRGTWTALEAVEALEVPDDLAAALDAAPPARASWERFAPSTRKQMLWSILQAKRPATREARIEEIVRHAALGERPPRYRPRT